MSGAGEVVSALATARRGVQLYPASHPAFAEALEALVSAVLESAETPFVLNWYQGRLYHESVVVPEDAHGQKAIAEALELRGIESLTFQPTFCIEDALGLTEVLAMRVGSDFDVEQELSRREVCGVTVSVLVDESDPEREQRERRRQADRALYQRTIAALRRLRERLGDGAAGDLGDAPHLVSQVMERLLSDPSAMLGLATIRGTSEHSLFHSLNVMIYALVLGQHLGLPDEGLASLGMSALLHDVGKTAFMEHDPAQAEPMRRMHPEVGAEILQRAAVADPAPMLVAYEHHMHADGGGWPERSPDYVAHPYSRMVAVADHYENLTNPSNGEPALTPDRAIVAVLNEGGSSLDPFFVRLFANALGVFPVGCLVRLSDHSVGVVSASGDDPLAPLVALSYDERGNDLEERPLVDLALGEVRIVEVISPESLAVAVADKL